MPNLAERIADQLRGRTLCVVGVGNPMRGDDAAGPLVIEQLGGHDGAERVDAGTTPENWYGPLLASAPEVVLFVDAADHGAAPGEWVLVPAEEMAERVGTTHAPTLRLLARLLSARGIECLLLGIQPGDTATGAAPCPAVVATAGEAAAAIAPLLHAEVRHG